MDQAVSVAQERHLVVHLADDHLCAVNGKLGVIYGNTEAAVSVLVRRSNGNHCNVNRIAGVEPVSDLMVVVREEVSAVIVEAFPGVSVSKVCDVAEMSVALRQHIGCRVKGYHVVNVHVLEPVSLVHHSQWNLLRSCGRVA